MASEEQAKEVLPPLMDRILQQGKQAFDPSIVGPEKAEGQRAFNELLQNTSTLALLPVLNLLVQPDRVFPWLRSPIIAALARLPLRRNGVQDTIEFVLSVHAGRTDQTAAAGRGANMSHEALNASSRLLSSPPKDMSAEEWFKGIAPQLFSLLQGEGEPEMDKAAAFIIGFGILGRRQYGAPGMPGWTAFAQPLLAAIDPSLETETLAVKNEDEVVDLDIHHTLASSTDLANAIKGLSTLLKSHPHPSLAKRLLAPILLPLWALSKWTSEEPHIQNSYREPARNLLRSYIQLAKPDRKSEAATSPKTANVFEKLIKNLTFQGRSDPEKSCWVYAQRDTGIEVRKEFRDINQAINKPSLKDIDDATGSFITLFKSLTDIDNEISNIFSMLYRRRIADGKDEHANLEVKYREPALESEDMTSKLIEIKLLQGLMTVFPDKLVGDSKQTLDLISQVLSEYEPEDPKYGNNRDTFELALSIFNIVLTSANFKDISSHESIQSIRNSLSLISKDVTHDISSTASNLLFLLKYRGTVAEDENQTVMTDAQVEDRKTYSLAMSYLTTADSPPPVRVQGLELLSSLIKSNSSVIDIPALLLLFSSVLQDNDEYIHLRVIKSFIQLAARHPKTVMKDLIERYVDPDEEYELDSRLRLGEALLQIIQEHPAALVDDTAHIVCQGLLSIAGRRGRRPKTERAQERELRLAAQQRERDDDEEEETYSETDSEAETEQHRALSQIVSGWASKRGREDIRIRASALSIMGSALESNIGGLGAASASTAVDVAMHVLTLEPAAEKGILRRAAMLLLLGFVRVLDAARSSGAPRLGFGLAGQSLADIQRVLAYVRDTDGDGLVRQHAADVLESLDAYQLNSLIPAAGDGRDLDVLGSGIRSLRELSVNPSLGGSADGRGSSGPRIEEIE